MESNEIKKGDQVKVKSGSPRMTVNEILENDQIECLWFDEKNQHHYETFSRAVLKKIDENIGGIKMASI
jgi:uncharacterized protein YodC (DUF2158 family)